MDETKKELNDLIEFVAQIAFDAAFRKPTFIDTKDDYKAIESMFESWLAGCNGALDRDARCDVEMAFANLVDEHWDYETEMERQ